NKNPFFVMISENKTIGILFVFILVPLFFIAVNKPSYGNGLASKSAVDTTSINKDLAEQVLIRRTEYGVPHIEAENIRAAGFALGYVQMEDYGEEVIEGLIRARGERSRYIADEISNLDRAIDSDAANRQDYARAVETWQYLEKDT